ncbi:MAG: hypothetical protein ACE15F_16410, partial [bacterium]
MKNNYIYIIVFYLFAVIDFPLPVYSQGFLIKPLKIHCYPYPGRIIEEKLVIRNILSNKNIIVDLNVSDLTQNDEGAWKIIDSNNSPDNKYLYSCKDWISLNTNTLEISPLNSVTLNIRIKVPANKYGFYTACLLAQTRKEPNVKGIAVVIRYLIPILVEIKGPVLKKQIEITDANIKNLESNDKIKS